MFGVSIVQWRASIGSFRIFRTPGKCFKTDKIELFNEFIIFLKPPQEFCSLFFSILHGLILVFGFSLLIVLIFSILTILHFGLRFLFLQVTAPLGTLSSSIHFLFFVPRGISIFINCIRLILILNKNLAFRLIVISTLLVLAGIEVNPGPTPQRKLSFAVWNLDSLPARDFARIPLIEAFQAEHHLDFFGICETALTSDITNESIFIDGFSPDPIRADKADDTRNGGVCLYFRENLPVKSRPDLASIPETLVAEIKLNRKKIFFVLSYRHPSTPLEEFCDYVKSLETIYENINRENPSVTIISGDFNARSPLFWENDTQTKEGEIFSNFLISNNMEELINEPTHVRDNGSQSCIDLICTDQPYLFVDTGVLPSLDPHSKHNIIQGQLNFHSPSPPPYKRRIWDYTNAKIECIKNSLKDMDWNQLFYRLNVDQMALVFTDIVLDIFSKNIPNKIVTCHDRDAPWITPQVKTAIKRNNRVYSKWNKGGRKPEGRPKVVEVQKVTNEFIREAKNTYHEKLGNLLSDPSTGQKHFWSAFKKLSNKKKTTNIPPIIENVYISNFSQKASLFNEYFADQCTIIDNGSVLPPLNIRTSSQLSDIKIDPDKIVEIILSLNAKKAHGCDGISMAMLKLCPDEIAVPLSIIFQRCVSNGMFPDSWKLANVQPIHKKNDRQIKSNYRPISLLPLCGKILEKIIFDQVYSFLDKNRLISSMQSGFRPGDSCIFQLISITSEIYRNFEKHDETRAVFLDISKAFDKVWHDGLIHKLKCNGISGNLLAFFENYIHNRHQRVTLNGTESDWRSISAGVPQGSVLGPLLFLIYINDLTENIKSQMRLFADDSFVFTPVKKVEVSHEQLVNDLETVSNWGYQWKMVFNPDITKQAVEVIFSVKKKKPFHPELKFNDIPVAREDYTKHLGLFLDSRLNFSKHITEAIRKATKGLSLMKYLSKYVSRKVLALCYKLYVRPHLDYGDVIYHNQRQDLMTLIEQVQYKAALIVTGCWQGTSRVKLYDELGWEALDQRRWGHRMTTWYKIVNGLTPAYLFEHVPKEAPRPLRSFIPKAPIAKTERYQNSFFPYCINEWNSLEKDVKYSSSLENFKESINSVIRPEESFCTESNKYGMKLLTQIRVEFSDLREHRFNHKFNCPSPICSCGKGEETATHFLLSCPRYSHLRSEYLSKISQIVKSDVTVFPDDHLTDLLLYGSESFNDVSNSLILNETINFIFQSERFKTLEAYS